MFHIEDVLQLKDEERVKALVRRHLATLLPSLLLSTVLIVVPFFMLFPMFGWGILGVFLFAASVLIGIGIAVRALILWDADVLVITNLRLVDVDQRGIFSRLVSEIPLQSVADVAWARKGLWETLFRMGSVNVQTHSGTVKCTVQSIPHPESLYEAINDLRRELGHAAVPKAATDHAPAADGRKEKLKRIMTLLEKYDPEELDRIENVLKARERESVADAFFSRDGEARG